MTAGQQEAIDQMQYMMTDDYWIREAHANGDFDSDDWFRQRAKDNRQDLLLYYTSRAGIAHWAVGFMLGFALIVVCVTIVVCVRNANARRRREREEEVRVAEEAEARRVQKVAREKEQAKVSTTSDGILKAISQLISSCGQPATEMMLTASALSGAFVAEPKSIVVHDVAAILLAFLNASSRGGKYIERVWRGIAGRYLRGQERSESCHLHDYASSGDRPLLLVEILSDYDRLQGTKLASEAATAYLSITGEVASHCGDSLAMKLVARAYVELLTPYVQQATKERSSSHTNSSSSEKEVCDRCVRGYQLLGLPVGASEDEVRKKRRAWAEVLHPDQLGGKSYRARDTGEEQLKSINSACDHIFECRFTNASA